MDYLPDLIERLVARARAGDEFAIKMVLERVAAPLRPQGAAVNVPNWESAQGLTAKAEAILAALVRGQVPVDAGRSLLEALAVVGKIAELEDLARRVGNLEQLRGANCDP